MPTVTIRPFVRSEIFALDAIKFEIVPNEVTLGCAAVCSVPVRVVAVTPEIPVIFVALSPTIFPFAFMFPVNVETPDTINWSVSVVPVISTP